MPTDQSRPFSVKKATRWAAECRVMAHAYADCGSQDDAVEWERRAATLDRYAELEEENLLLRRSNDLLRGKGISHEEVMARVWAAERKEYKPEREAEEDKERLDALDRAGEGLPWVLCFHPHFTQTKATNERRSIREIIDRYLAWKPRM